MAPSVVMLPPEQHTIKSSLPHVFPANASDTDSSPGHSPDMASSPDEQPPPAAFEWKTADPSIFPDGIKTSGQLDPEPHLLVPYEDFPDDITGPTVWHAADYADHPDRWVHRFTPDENAALSAATDAFAATTTPLHAMTAALFPLPPALTTFLASVRREILHGRGFILFRGVPVTEWGVPKTAIAYMGLGAHLGLAISQNGRGHVLGHVKDVGGDTRQLDRTRIYRTTARQFFHTDDCDIVGLLCVARALQGGESDIVSAHAVYNHLRAHNPDALRTLASPTWYFDRKGEVSAGQLPYIRAPIMYREPPSATAPAGRVYTKWDPYYVTSLQRFWDAGTLPPLSPAQTHAMAVLESTCAALALHMVLAVGDVQFLANTHVLHARSAYTDHPPPAPRRHLMRLWLSVAEGEEGEGWRLPFADSRHPRRSGVQVDDTPPRAPLDAE